MARHDLNARWKELLDQPQTVGADSIVVDQIDLGTAYAEQAGADNWELEHESTTIVNLPIERLGTEFLGRTFERVLLYAAYRYRGARDGVQRMYIKFTASTRIVEPRSVSDAT
jgi:hypothetical protein